MDAKIPVPGPSPTSLIEKATNILEVAQAQHDAADQQHLNADKLEELGHALEASAVEIEGKKRMDAGRSRDEEPLGEIPDAAEPDDREP